jgi:hypothetical protein
LTRLGADGDSPATVSSPTSDATRTEVEAWFRRRGVPQLIQGYGSESRIDARAAPLIAIWLAAGTVLFWGVNPEWPPASNVLAVLATLLFIGGGAIALRWFRRGSFGGGTTIHPLEVVTLAALPALAAAIIDGTAVEFVAVFLNVLLGFGLIYLIVGFGLVEIGAWAVARLGSQLTEMIGLLGRTLPLLLILVVFLLFAAELWEAAHHLGTLEVAALVGLLLLIAVVLVVTSIRRELHQLELMKDWSGVLAGADHRPTIISDKDAARPIPPPGPMGWLERVNVVALGLIGVLIQALSVSVLVMAFLVVFGLLAVPADVQAGWIGEPVREVAGVSLLGEHRVITGELLTVGALLSGIVGLYFTGLAVTDSAYRGEYLDRLLAELRDLLAVRAWYLGRLNETQEVEGQAAAASP